MLITNLEMAQASVEIVCGLVSCMLGIIVFINGLSRMSMKRIMQMLFIAAGIFFAEAAAYIFRGNVDPVSILMTRVGNFAVFLGNLVLANVSTQYIYSVLQQKGTAVSPRYRTIVRCFTLAAAGILVVNLFTGWMYYFTPDNYYHRSIGWYVYTLATLVCLLTACTLSLRYRRLISRGILASILLLELFPIIAIVIQSLIYGFSITNVGIGFSIVLVLITYLIDWNHTQSPSQAENEKARRSYEIIVLFVIMVVSVGASIVSCIVSLRRVAGEMSVSHSQIVAHVVSDRINDEFLRPITVADTMARDTAVRAFLRASGEESPEHVEAEAAEYLDSIRSGFGYSMVYAISDRSRAYYTGTGICAYIDPDAHPHDLWYRAFLEQDAPYALNVDTDETNHWTLSVFVNTRVPDTDGSLLGVCGVGVEMEQLQQLLQTFETQYHIRIDLIDTAGLIQVDTDAQRIGQSFLSVDFLQAVGAEDFYSQELEDTRRLTRFLPELGWYLVVEDLNPGIIDVFHIIAPNVVILLAGLFVLAVAGAVIVIRERKIAAELSEKRRLSLYDELTGLRNRRAFELTCDRITNEGSSGSLTVLVMDLNSLKEANDSHGHQFGDAMLIGAAKCMTMSFREFGPIYRTGGDEFIALLHCSPKQLAEARKTFAHQTSQWKGSSTQSISVAMGICTGAEADDLQSLLQLADQRMYADKNEYYRLHHRSRSAR